MEEMNLQTEIIVSYTHKVNRGQWHPRTSHKEEAVELGGSQQAFGVRSLDSTLSFSLHLCPWWGLYGLSELCFPPL